nr:hypothetical protein [Tanacetum cinerariifolium]
MLESKAYKTYYAFAFGEKTPKPKLKTKAKVDKSDKKKQPTKMPKAKGLDVLFKDALTEAEQLKLASKRSKTQFHISQASGSGDGTDFESKVPDEQHLKMTGADEGTGTIPGVPDVPKYEYESEKESWGDSGEEDEDDENNSEDKSDGNDDDGNDDNNQEVDDMDDDNEETDSVRIELDRIKIHVLNHFTTTIPPPPLFFNPLLQQATPTLAPTNSEATTSFSSLLDFSSIFRFNERVTNLEKDFSEIKQVDQYAHSISLILAIVDRNMDNNLGEAIHKAIQSHNAECREEAQSKKQEYIDNVDSIVRTITREEVKTQLPKILPKAASAFEALVIEKYELIKILLDKMEESKSHLRADYKKELYDALVKSYKTDKDLFNTYGKPYPFDLSKPLPLIQDHRGCEVIPQDFFINNDLEYLKGGDLSRRKRIITVTRLLIMKKYDYGHLEEIKVRREDQKL